MAIEMFVRPRPRTRPPLYSRLGLEEIHNATPFVQDIVTGIARAVSVAGEADAEVAACLQTTGRLLVQLRGREPVPMAAMSRRDYDDPAEAVHWQVPRGENYLPLQVSVPWNVEISARRAVRSLAKWGIQRSYNNASYPTALNSKDLQAPILAPEIQVRPRVRRKKDRFDPTMPLSVYAKKLIAKGVLADAG